MHTKSIVPVLLLALLCVGCASKKDLEAVQAQLAACEADKQKLEADVIAWEERFDSASNRWNDVEASVSEALPTAINEFHTERERIIELVPEQVQGEVTAYLDDYFTTVMQGFGKLAEDNKEIKLQLNATHKALEAVGADTRAISTAIDQSVSEERAMREDEAARRERVATRLAETVDLIVEFDQTRLNCKDCPERIRLRDKSREVLLAFHAELMSDLADLQRFAGDPPNVP
ncbi:MAG: hypothetical protein AAF560_12770 [Acidobacteriota bacterium]